MRVAIGIRLLTGLLTLVGSARSVPPESAIVAKRVCVPKTVQGAPIRQPFVTPGASNVACSRLARARSRLSRRIDTLDALQTELDEAEAVLGSGFEIGVLKGRLALLRDQPREALGWLAPLREELGDDLATLRQLARVAAALRDFRTARLAYSSLLISERLDRRERVAARLEFIALLWEEGGAHVDWELELMSTSRARTTEPDVEPWILGLQRLLRDGSARKWETRRCSWPRSLSRFFFFFASSSSGSHLLFGNPFRSDYWLHLPPDVLRALVGNAIACEHPLLSQRVLCAIAGDSAYAEGCRGRTKSSLRIRRVD